jgi:hypothetical protein
MEGRTVTQNLSSEGQQRRAYEYYGIIHRKHAVLKVSLTLSKLKEYKGYKQRGGEVQKESGENIVRGAPQSNECSLRDHGQLIEKRRRVCSACE